MKPIYNIKDKKVLAAIKRFKNKNYANFDIKFKNTHLRRINALLPFDIFSKNDVYISSKTLWELMQPIGMVGSHNYHELNQEDIFNALNKLCDPLYVIKVKNERIAIVPVFISSFSLPLMVVIEIGAKLRNNPFAKINKIVTIYPKSDLETYIEKMDKQDVLYIKNVKEASTKSS